MYVFACLSVHGALKILSNLFDSFHRILNLVYTTLHNVQRSPEWSFAPNIDSLVGSRLIHHCRIDSETERNNNMHAGKRKANFCVDGMLCTK